MTTPCDLLTRLHQQGVILAAEGETLHCRAPQGTLTAQDKTDLAEHKEALLTILERWEEKAAILEYDAGYARADAERLAWEGLRLTWELEAGGGRPGAAAESAA